MAKILLLLVLKANGCHIEILLPVSIFTLLSSTACDFASTYEISSKYDHNQRSYNVILIFQDGSHGTANLLPVSDLVTSLIHFFRKAEIFLLKNLDESLSKSVAEY